MKYSVAFLIAFPFLLISLLQAQSVQEGELLIQFHNQVDPVKTLEAWNADRSNWGFELKRQLVPSMNISHVLFNPINVSFDEALEYAKSQSAVIIAQGNHGGVHTRINEPNDPGYSNQWGLNNTAPGAAHANEAWDKVTGGVTAHGDTIVIAIVDGGADLAHPDVNFYQNHHEIPNNGIDDDQNGYIDDVNGWNAYASTGTIPVDFHGQHCSGIAGAIGDNGIGVSGVSWDVEIMPVAASSGMESVVLEGYGYVLAMRKKYNETQGDSGAYVVATNSSFGVNFGDPVNFPLWCNFYDSLGAAGILSCGATANLNIDVDVSSDVPTACLSDFMLSVTNMNASGLKSGNAAYGLTMIDLGAPGTGIYSTLPNNQYGNLSGTSMATPHVAGAIGLMYAGICERVLDEYQNDPAGLALKIRDAILEEGTDFNTSLTGNTVTGGKLNVAKCIDAVLGWNCLDVTASVQPDSCYGCSGMIDLAVAPTYGVGPFEFLWNNGDTTAQLTGLCSGNYAVTVTDSLGFQFTDSLEVITTDSISVSVTTTPETPNLANGEISLQVFGGTGNFTYAWSNGKSTAVNSEIQAGNYTVTITDEGGCNTVLEIQLSALSSVSELTTKNLRIYPNPTHGSFQISGSTEVEKVELFSLQGKLLQTFSAHQLGSQLNIDKYASGSYLIRIHEGLNVTNLVLHKQ